MGKPTGFLDYTRVNCPSRDAAARTGDYAPVELPRRGSDSSRAYNPEIQSVFP